jgi:hypothetical protein
MLILTLIESREFENVLILQALHSSPIYPSLAGRMQLTETSLTTLRLRTIKRLSGYRPDSPLLTRDLKTLHVLRPQGDSVASLDLAIILAGVNSS